MNSYEELESRFRRINHIDHVQQIASWDEAAMMPEGGGEARGRAMATLSVIAHELITDPAMDDLLSDAEALGTLSEWQSANLKQMRRNWSQAVCVPGDLVEALATATSRCEQAWRRLRAENDWAALQPMLGQVLNLVRQSADLRAEATGLDPYDALLDLYEPGLTSASIGAIFGELKSFLPDLLEEVLDRQSGWQTLPVNGPFPLDRQKELGHRMMEALGFDFHHGRLDVSHHPFCGGVADDVRLTTRYRDDNFIDALMGTLHETGHALYQQGLPVDWREQPVGESLGMAVHESQSLIMEMQACRSSEFLQFLIPVAREILRVDDGTGRAWEADNLLQHFTRASRSKIRVEADEVTYPLHIILRFELERDLLDGSLLLADLPGAWDEKMQAYLGISTLDDDRDGCMQDVHWMAGIFGYFPTYSLGAMMAAQLYACAVDQVPAVPGAIALGDFAPLVSWLRQHVHGQGCLITADELLQRATGSGLDPDYFKRHLLSRYLDR